MFQTCSINLLLQDVIKESVQQDILTCTIHSEVLKDKPLSHSYVANFMKSFMSKVIYQLVRCVQMAACYVRLLFMYRNYIYSYNVAVYLS